MYLDDAIGSDDCTINHVPTLATFFARLRLHKLNVSPDKPRIGAAHVDFIGHLISAYGVQNLLGGLSYYRKFLHNMARRIRPTTEQCDGSICHTVYVSRATLANE